MAKTVKDVLNTLNDDQKIAVTSLLAAAVDDDIKHSDDNEEDDIIDCEEFMHAAFSNAKRDGSLKEAVIEHSAEYGIEDIGELFPEAHAMNKEPMFFEQDVDWANEILQNVTKSPFPRVKQLFAKDESRAHGYKKGTAKYEDYISTSSRSIEPTTVYKKTKIDRDDMIDITDFDAAAFIRKSMKTKLDEEIARAILVGDGREAFDNDKIDETCIIPIVKDSDIMMKKIECAKSIVDDPEAFMNAMLKNRKAYKGSGKPTLFITEESLCELLLMKDANGRRLHKTEAEVASVLRVNKIITVAELFDTPIAADDNNEYFAQAVMVNMRDYAVGQSNQGKVSMFDDFDIDYNQQKYLIETRLSGGLIKPESALVFQTKVAVPVDEADNEAQGE